MQIVFLLYCQCTCGVFVVGLLHLSECCLHLGNTRRALQLSDESLSIASQSRPANHPHIARCTVNIECNKSCVEHYMLAVVCTIVMNQLSSCHHAAGNLDEAIDIAQRCIAIHKQHLPHTRQHLCGCKR